MQLFVRDLAGHSRSFTVSSTSELIDQVHAAFDLPAASARLSYASRPVSDDSTIPNNATLDLSLRLPGGGPKKRCAHVFVKPGSAATSASPSGAATPVAPAPASAASSTEASAGTSAGAEQKEGDSEKEEGDATVQVVEEAAAPTAAAQPAMERCSSAALRMVGECPRCENNFCGAHRLPEDHACPALSMFKRAAFEENRQKLAKEATIASKISAF